MTNFRITCWYCQKPVTNDIPGNVVFRAIAVCPECIEKSPENLNHPANETSDHCYGCANTIEDTPIFDCEICGKKK